MSADFFQMQVHGSRVCVWQNESDPRIASGANSPKDIGTFVTQITGHPWAGTRSGPYSRQSAFLADPRFILEPEFNFFAFGAVGERSFDFGDEVFLKSSSNAGSFCGCTARVETWL